ncbi:hypothetical protein SLEP1_g19360 [Rubroshorea leprosula]|nr:hypothetical protein SLEP1_g19360 [Rubroshorea leprosula]
MERHSYKRILQVDEYRMVSFIPLDLRKESRCLSPPPSFSPSLPLSQRH